MNDERISTGANESESYPEDIQLVSCQECQRKFREDRIEKHEQICSRIRQKQLLRGVYDSKSSRLSKF